VGIREKLDDEKMIDGEGKELEEYAETERKGSFSQSNARAFEAGPQHHDLVERLQETLKRLQFVGIAVDNWTALAWKREG